MTDDLAQQLTRRGVKVMSPSDIRALIGVERQKQLLGCDDDTSSCLAELGDALGADGVVTGNLGKFGDSFQLNVKIVAHDGNVLTTYSQKFASEAALVEGVSAAAKQLAKETYRAMGREAPVAIVDDTQPSRFGRPAVLVPLAVGVAFVGAGIGLRLASQQELDALTSPAAPMTDGEISSHVSQGRTYQALSFVGFGLGAAALITGAVLAVKGPSNDTAVSFVPSTTGGSIAVAGSFR